MNLPSLMLVALSALASGAVLAQTDDAALLKCAQATDPGARLACFDALAAQARQRTVAAASGQPDPRKVADFGRPPKPDASDIELLESRINGSFDTWRANQRFTLANGQVWQITDDGSGYVGEAQNPVVRIRRGAMGSYLMEVDGLRKALRVKRVQ